MTSTVCPVLVTLCGNQPNCFPNPVIIQPGDQVAVEYVLDPQAVSFGYYIAGFFDRTPYTRSYLNGTPQVRNPAVNPEQAYTGFTITNTNFWPPKNPPGSPGYPGKGEPLVIDVVLMIKNLQAPGITILFDPQDQDSQA